MCYSLDMNKKTPEWIEFIINEIFELEKKRDALFCADTDESDKEAYTLDDKIVDLIFDELKDNADFEKYLNLKAIRDR